MSSILILWTGLHISNIFAEQKLRGQEIFTFTFLGLQPFLEKENVASAQRSRTVVRKYTFIYSKM